MPLLRHRSKLLRPTCIEQGHPTDVGVDAYLDQVQLWLKEPLDNPELAALRNECGRGGLHTHNGPAFFDSSYRQRLQLRQPSSKALGTLADRDGVLLNCVEVALDWLFPDPEFREVAYRLVCRYHVKKCHRKQGIRLVQQTRYTGPRWAPNVFVLYPVTTKSEKTGKEHCLHLEWRISGAEALRKAGLASVYDLLGIDYRTFWEKRLLLYKIDTSKLGRLFNNRLRQSKRRRPWIVRHANGFTYHVDRRLGDTLLRSGRTTQAMVDAYGGLLNIRSCLSPIEVEYLPDPRGKRVYCNYPPKSILDNLTKCFDLVFAENEAL